jgi:hypothetical protein
LGLRNSQCNACDTLYFIKRNGAWKVTGNKVKNYKPEDYLNDWVKPELNAIRLNNQESKKKNLSNWEFFKDNRLGASDGCL